MLISHERVLKKRRDGYTHDILFGYNFIVFMKSAPITIIVPAVCAVLALAALGFWLAGGRAAQPFALRVPGQDLPVNPAQAAIDLKGVFTKSTGTPADLPGLWPGFRGPGLDGVSRETARLARSWGPDGPRELWSVEMGEGYAGPAVRNGRVYVLDYDQENRLDVLRCLSLADGQEIWRRAYPVKVKRNHGMSRTVPAVSDQYVVTLGPKCHVLCVDADTGDYRWGIDLVREYGTKVPAWYAGQCPLIDGDRVILAPGGDALMIAVDAASGEVLWKTPNPRGWPMSHSSIMPMTFNGRRMYVYCAEGGVAGVAPEDGRILWETSEWRIKIATIPTPIPLANGCILLVGGYNAGSMMLQLTEQDGQITAKPLFRLRANQFSSDQQTPILYKDHVYGVIQGGQLVCIDLQGKVKWTSGSQRFGLGPYIIADGMLYLINDSGTLTLAEATPAGYRQLAQARVLHGHDAWGPPAIAGGRLLVRDLTRMVCLDVGVR